MKTLHEHNGFVYEFSNEGLKEGDKVFPVSKGRSDSINFTYAHEKFDFSDISSGFPEEPHTIVKMRYSDYKPYETQTSHGYGPIEKYFKVLNKVKIGGEKYIPSEEEILVAEAKMEARDEQRKENIMSLNRSIFGGKKPNSTF